MNTLVVIEDFFLENTANLSLGGEVADNGAMSCGFANQESSSYIVILVRNSLRCNDMLSVDREAIHLQLIEKAVAKFGFPQSHIFTLDYSNDRVDVEDSATLRVQSQLATLSFSKVNIVYCGESLEHHLCKIKNIRLLLGETAYVVYSDWAQNQLFLDLTDSIKNNDKVLLQDLRENLEQLDRLGVYVGRKVRLLVTLLKILGVGVLSFLFNIRYAIVIPFRNLLRYLRVAKLHLTYKHCQQLPLSDGSVIIAPHPDDEVIGCAGLIRTLVERGMPPHVIIMTGGGGSHRGCCSTPEEEIVIARRKLTVKALEALGLPMSHLHLLDYPDGGISAEHSETKRIQMLLSEISPKAIFVPHWGEEWSDHINAASIAKECVKDKGVSIYEYCVWLWYFNVNNNLHRKSAFILKMSRDTYHCKLLALDEYMLPLAPCGNPWSGILPQVFLKAARWNKELYFKTK